MNFKEILEKLKNSGVSIDYFANNDYDAEALNLGKIEEVDQVGGEGEGDHWHSVKYFKDHNIYIKVEGFYSSYSGTEFEDWDDSCKEVIPQQKTITVYE